MIRIPTRLIILVSSTLVETYYTQKPVTPKALAEQYGLSPNSLIKSLKELCKSNILFSHNRNAGYILLKNPQTLTIADILITIEGEDKFECCRKLLSDLNCVQSRCDDCVVASAFHAANKHKYDTLRSITLYDLYLSRGNKQIPC